MLYQRNVLYQIILICLFSGFFLSTSKAKEPSEINTLLTDGMSASVGLEYDSGDYGTTSTTDTWRIPFGLHYSKGQYFGGLSLPYVSSKNTGNSIISSSASHKKIISTRNTGSSTESGLGDLELYAGYIFPEKVGQEINYNITVRVKLATADENKGLGTGENDYAIEAGLLSPLSNFSLFASLGYQLNGDTATIKYDDVVYANGGITLPLEAGNNAGAMLDYSQAASAGIDDALGLTGFYNMKLTNKRSLYIYVMFGLSDGSPDYGLGTNYRFGF